MSWVHVRTISESPVSEEYHIISETMEDPQFLVAEADDLQDSHPEEGNDSDDAIDQIRDQDRWDICKFGGGGRVDSLVWASQLYDAGMTNDQ